MDDISSQDRAVELLQQLGLKEYESKSFVALARRDKGTAKEISETSDVPRTRVYDAIRVLESKGLVETQHTNPQVFRAVSVDEAVDTLRTEYEQRIESLRESLDDLDPVASDSTIEITHEVWALSGEQGIVSRTQQLLDSAEQEILMVIGDERVFDERLKDHLMRAYDRGVTIVLGTKTEEMRTTITESLPDIDVYVSGLEWLSKSSVADDDTEISRLLLVDRESILVSSYSEFNSGMKHDEQAVFGRGFDNGLVAIVRRLMATGLLSGKGRASGGV